MNVAAGAQQAKAKTQRADDSEWMDHAVRVGLVSYGVVHLLIAWLAQPQQAHLELKSARC